MTRVPKVGELLRIEPWSAERETGPPLWHEDYWPKHLGPHRVLQVWLDGPDGSGAFLCDMECLSECVHPERLAEKVAASELREDAFAPGLTERWALADARAALHGGAEART